jgi:hypothetical protein
MSTISFTKGNDLNCPLQGVANVVFSWLFKFGLTDLLNCWNFIEPIPLHPPVSLNISELLFNDISITLATMKSTLLRLDNCKLPMSAVAELFKYERPVFNIIYPC